jgi:predicted alpha/beta superfamily hydrolase
MNIHLISTRILLLFALLILARRLTAQAQTNSDDPKIVIGTKKQLHSEILQEDRPYWVSLPESYGDKKYPDQTYPVVYLLDGGKNFHSYTGLQKELSDGPYASIPEMIVVAIPNTNRTRDLTPTKISGMNHQFDNAKKMFADSGGNQAFLSFISKELRPHIQKNYRTNGYTMLIGHSFGGLTVINTLLNHTDLFDAYIAIDPSLWWDNQVMLQQADSLLKEKTFNNQSFYFSLAAPPANRDKKIDMQASNKGFKKLLEGHDPHGLRWQWKFYEDENHGTVPIPTEYDGLRYIFEGYQTQVRQIMKNPENLVPKFDSLSTKLGHRFIPSAPYLDWMGDFCLKNGTTENAITFFELYQKWYPNSDDAIQKLEKARADTTR